jgi:transposase
LENQEDQRAKWRQQDSMNDAKQEFGLQSKQFGALLIIDHFLERLKLSNLLKNAINCSDNSHKIDPYKCLLLMVMNLIDGRKPLYEIKEWTAEFAPQILPIGADQIEHLNDDRIGRNLDKLFDADRASLQTNIVLQAIKEFGIIVDELHNDSTTITFTGKYKDANGDAKRGKKTYYYTFRFCFYLLPSEAGPLPHKMPEIDMSLFWIPCHPCQRD